MLVDCHAHIIPEQALRQFPDPGKPAYVTAEPVALQRMLDEHDRVGITHAVVSDSFFMESSRDALPDWSSVDRAKLFNDGMVELVGIAGYYSLIAMTLNAFRSPIPDGPVPFKEPK